MLIERLYGKNIGSTIRSAQVVCVVAMVVIAALGCTSSLIMWSALALPAQSNLISPSVGAAWIGVAMILLAALVWRWYTGTNDVRQHVSESLVHDQGQSGFFEDIISRWATQRVSFVKPLIAVAVVSLMGAAGTRSVLVLALNTLFLLGLCTFVFPTQRRAFAWLRNAIADGADESRDVDQALSEAVEVYIRDPSRPHPWRDAARVEQHFGKIDGRPLARAAEAITKEVALKVVPDWNRTTIEVHLFEVARYLRRVHPELSSAAISAIVWLESYSWK